MHCSIVLIFACLAVFASANPSGHGAGVVIQGASAGGIVVPGHGSWGGHGGWGGHGAWGGHGGWGGNGAWGGHGGWAGNGAWAGNGGYAGHGAWGGWAGHGVDAVIAPGVAVVGPAASAAGHGVGLAVGAGHAAAGHGVAVVGPATVPATIVGPSGKIVADGLYGVDHRSFGHGGHGHW